MYIFSIEFRFLCKCLLGTLILGTRYIFYLGLNWSQLNLISNSIIFLLLWIFHENYILSNYFETKSLNHCSWNKIFFSPWRSYYDFVNLETPYGICFRGLYPPKFLGKNEFWYFYIFWHFNLCWVSPWN